MSAGGGGGHPGSQDFELNLAPIIDCFTVLVTFLLASSTFISIGLLDAGISAGAASATDSEPPPIQITLSMQKNKSIVVRTEGKMKQTVSVQPVDGKFGLKQLGEHLTGLRKQFPTVTGLTVNPDDANLYNEVIEVMDEARKTQPAVLLGSQ